MFEAFIAVAAAIITATGAVALDRRFQQQDLRRDIYLEWLRLLDNWMPWIREALVDPRSQLEMKNQFEREVNAMSARMSLLASERVLEKVRAFQEASRKYSVDDLRAEAEKEGLSLEQAIQRRTQTLEPHRKTVIAAMRSDMRPRFWPRRGV